MTVFALLPGALTSFINIILFVYFWLCWVFVAVRAFSSCRSWTLLFIVVPRLLIAVASPVVEHRLWARGLSSDNTQAQSV